MSFQVKSAEPVTDAVRRVVGEQLDRALAVSCDARLPADWRIHELRVHLKRSRAAIGLVERGVGGAARRDRRVLREVGQVVARQRDRAAEAQALRALSRRLVGRAQGTASVALQGELARVLSLDDDETLLRRAARELARARRAVCRWRVPHGRRAVCTGVRRSYGRARRAYRRAREDDGDAAFHDWRKKVKELGWQIDLLRRAAPDARRALGPRLRRLGRLLGELHDLAGLRATLRGVNRKAGRVLDRDPLLVSIDARVEALRGQVRALGAQAFEARPRALAARVETSWRAWR